MALAVPTHLENEARRLLGDESSRATENCSGFGMNSWRSRAAPSSIRNYQRTFRRGKFAYLSLNTPTPCPPCGAVPVNRGKSCCVPGRITGSGEFPAAGTEGAVVEPFISVCSFFVGAGAASPVKYIASALRFQNRTAGGEGP